MNMESRAFAAMGFGLFGFGLVSQPVVRAALQASMMSHMFVLVLGVTALGYLLAYGIEKLNFSFEVAWPDFNAMGLSSWLFVLFRMLPATMDQAVDSNLMSWGRNVNLLLAGALLRLSLKKAHPFLSLFFAWNLVTMLFIQGHLYLNLPERVCNAYLLGDQENTAKAMILSAAVAGLLLIIKAYNQATATLTIR
jgi:hypothetical protein